jgi:hypothetical protein
MTQIAALLKPKVKSEITLEKKPKHGYMTLMDWSKIGKEDSVSVKFYKHSVTCDTIKVKVSKA